MRSKTYINNCDDYWELPEYSQVPPWLNSTFVTFKHDDCVVTARVEQLVKEPTPTGYRDVVACKAILPSKFRGRIFEKYFRDVKTP
jgi:hypothetical protein